MSQALHLPDNLPSIADAKLPQGYEAAKRALAECARVDECATWAKKAEAMASYAKQARDTALHEFADRIQARAIRRCGELLSAIEPARGGDRRGPTGGRPPVGPTRTSVARDAGLSRDQMRQALRVANVPADDFEAAIERARPATVTELAQRGTRPPVRVIDHLRGRDPKDFQAATSAVGELGHFVQFLERLDIPAVLRGTYAVERRALARHAATIGLRIGALRRALRRHGGTS